MNVLNSEVMYEIDDVLKNIEQNSAINSIIFISGKPGCFVAGADINIIRSFKTPEDGYKIAFEAQKIFEKIEKSKKPIIAAIQGSCLGGGLEVYNLINLYILFLQNIFHYYSYFYLIDVDGYGLSLSNCCK